MIKVLHLSDIHLGTLTHGKLNPTTGINSRLEDFERSLALCIDRALSEPADLVLFGGDAFPDAMPAPQVQQIFASQFRRLADAEIPTVLLVGNHDRHSQTGNSLSIYRSLGVPGFIVGDRLETHRIPTSSGEIQVICLPWLTRSAMLTKAETEGLSADGIGRELLKRLALILEAEIRQLDPELPTILLGHLMADRATVGAERFLAAGVGFTVPLSLLARSEFDYVALGHVHKHQVLCQDPPIVYPGSIERVDFGEENEEKGYIWLEIEKHKVDFQFCVLPARPFRTIEVDLTGLTEPTQIQPRLLAEIAKHDIKEAIARLIYKVKPEQLIHIDQPALHRALEAAHTYSILPEAIENNARLRLASLDRTAILDPYHALKLYISTRSDLESKTEELIKATQELLGEKDTAFNPPKDVRDRSCIENPKEAQLQIAL
jgi:DNA repair protein SbcD/Mre11